MRKIINTIMDTPRIMVFTIIAASAAVAAKITALVALVLFILAVTSMCSWWWFIGALILFMACILTAGGFSVAAIKQAEEDQLTRRTRP